MALNCEVSFFFFETRLLWQCFFRRPDYIVFFCQFWGLNSCTAIIPNRSEGVFFGLLTTLDCWANSDPVPIRAGTGRRLSRRPRTLGFRSPATSSQSDAGPCRLGPESPSQRTRRGPTRSSPRTSRPAARPSVEAYVRYGRGCPDRLGSRIAFRRYWSDDRAAPSPEPIRPCCPVR